MLMFLLTLLIRNCSHYLVKCTKRDIDSSNIFARESFELFLNNTSRYDEILFPCNSIKRTAIEHFERFRIKKVNKGQIEKYMFKTVQQRASFFYDFRARAGET